MNKSNSSIYFRVPEEKKEKWKKECEEKEISLTSFIINSVENKIQNNERKEIIKFIESQDNIFVKIGTNINQIAKVVNSQQYLGINGFENYLNLLSQVVKLKEEQNDIFLKLYHLLAKK